MGAYVASSPKPSRKPTFANPSQVCGEDRAGPIVDVIDMSDPEVKLCEAAQFGAPGAGSGPGVCRSSHQVYVTAKALAVPGLVEQLVQLARDQGPFPLLRFHGHGLPGCQFVYGDDYLPALEESRKARPDPKRLELFLYLAELEQRNRRSTSAISHWNLDRIAGALLKLTSCLAPAAEVWLMGCNVAQGLEGKALVDRLARLWGVTVKAGINTQFASSLFTRARGKYANYTSRGQK